MPLPYSLTFQGLGEGALVSRRLVGEGWQGYCQVLRIGIGGDFMSTAVSPRFTPGAGTQEALNKQ